MTGKSCRAPEEECVNGYIFVYAFVLKRRLMVCLTQFFLLYSFCSWIFLSPQSTIGLEHSHWAAPSLRNFKSKVLLNTQNLFLKAVAHSRWIPSVSLQNAWSEKTENIVLFCLHYFVLGQHTCQVLEAAPGWTMPYLTSLVSRGSQGPPGPPSGTEITPQLEMTRANKVNPFYTQNHHTCLRTRA